MGTSRIDVDVHRWRDELECELTGLGLQSRYLRSEHKLLDEGIYSGISVTSDSSVETTDINAGDREVVSTFHDSGGIPRTVDELCGTTTDRIVIVFIVVKRINVKSELVTFRESKKKIGRTRGSKVTGYLVDRELELTKGKEVPARSLVCERNCTGTAACTWSTSSTWSAIITIITIARYQHSGTRKRGTKREEFHFLIFHLFVVV